MILILVVFLLLTLYGCIKRETNYPLQGSSLIALRGICAIEIMIGHIGLETGSIVLYPNRKAGILFVGIFFMLSGYGHHIVNRGKENYFRAI